jgi:hypothetical protein
MLIYYYNTSVLPDQVLGWLGHFHVFRFRSVFKKVLKNRFFVLSSVCKKTGGKKPEIRTPFFNFSETFLFKCTCTHTHYNINLYFQENVKNPIIFTCFEDDSYFSCLNLQTIKDFYFLLLQKGE